ncbi:response regulator containing a CheY-like receiver domain and an HD-GYP domain [Sphaerochaeta pleomorpha str. Grapes]|uniref:Response regulator containing a CheY-like receiver domain and an HD-GYP domain n=1 Tax=Sphaerochaeta pleomorpha (strain ATCC BAA-1885 / DSM 22778 / Grapes) TaxID=158190 RepID=G8QX64_SPHPG|nr:HD domain-containing phosphohydrolase [Sphaerochaeta pleomorpha]AEV30649.1 response regulator containing a CheY-like receiver domain and an HD-GYP domain [Sphaerochaeta pleomorpha str. Grapes]
MNTSVKDSKVMIVDDTPANLELLEQILSGNGYQVMSYTQGARAFAAAVKFSPDLILSDIMMPEMDGFELCKQLKSDQNTADIPLIFLSAMDNPEDKIKGFSVGGVDYITKPFYAQEVLARVGTHLSMSHMRKELQAYNERLEDLVQLQVKEIHDSQLATITVISSLSECRDGTTGKHIQRTSILCRELAVELQRNSPYSDLIDDKFILDLSHAAPLHDIGKIGIPDSILMKPGKLTAEEFDIIKMHTLIGATALEKVHAQYPGNSFINMGVQLARSHHEKWNGTGYPDGLAGKSIPLCGRIMALVDVYDAISSKRPYKEASTHKETVQSIIRDSGTHFDPVIVQAFLQIEEAFAKIRDENGDAS